MPLFQFIGAAIGGSIVIAVASLIWPRISSDPRPPALTRVREMVIETPAGASLANVLGVADESATERINIHDMVSTGTTAVINTVATTAQRAVTNRVLETLASQFNSLPEEDKASFRAQICEPAPQP